jgi:hypothetical protein
MANTIPSEATKLKKLNKKTVRYTEVEQFKDSDLHMGYFVIIACILWSLVHVQLYRVRDRILKEILQAL